MRKLRIRPEKRRNRDTRGNALFYGGYAIFAPFYVVSTGFHSFTLLAIALVALCAFCRLLAVKAEPSRVGHLSPSARGLTTVKTLPILYVLFKSNRKCNIYHMCLSNTCRLLIFLCYLRRIYMMHFLRAMGFKKPCPWSHSICSLSSHRNVSSFVAMYRPSIVASFLRRQANFMWK